MCACDVTHLCGLTHEPLFAIGWHTAENIAALIRARCATHHATVWTDAELRAGHRNAGVDGVVAARVLWTWLRIGLAAQQWTTARGVGAPLGIVVGHACAGRLSGPFGITGPILRTAGKIRRGARRYWLAGVGFTHVARGTILVFATRNALLAGAWADGDSATRHARCALAGLETRIGASGQRRNLQACVGLIECCCDLARRAHEAIGVGATTLGGRWVRCLMRDVRSVVVRTAARDAHHQHDESQGHGKPCSRAGQSPAEMHFSQCARDTAWDPAARCTFRRVKCTYWVHFGHMLEMHIFGGCDAVCRGIHRQKQWTRKVGQRRVQWAEGALPLQDLDPNGIEAGKLTAGRLRPRFPVTQLLCGSETEKLDETTCSGVRGSGVAGDVGL